MNARIYKVNPIHELVLPIQMRRDAQETHDF